jgi:von Willebrand factor A domain-containing protein 8
MVGKSQGFWVQILGVSAMTANRRLEQIRKTLGENLLKLNDVQLSIQEPLNPSLVPNIADGFNLNSQETLAHLRWMIQKVQMGQDMYLIGEAGPLRRNLALLFAQIAQREVEYVRLSRDVTDADLKQRREIVEKTSIFVDQACVRAAIHGRILILDGIEVLIFYVESREKCSSDIE